MKNACSSGASALTAHPFAHSAVPGPLQPLGGERQKLWRRLEIPEGVLRLDVPEERGEQRQLRLDVALLAIPAQQRAQHEGMADVVHAGVAPERVAIKPRRAAQLIERFPGSLRAQSRSGAGEKERAVDGIGTQFVAHVGVAIERGDGARMKRYLA